MSLVGWRGSFGGAGAPWAFSLDFGLLFGVLAGTALLLAYRLGFSPSHDFEASTSQPEKFACGFCPSHLSLHRSQIFREFGSCLASREL
jgi:hypothetical protein